MRELICSGTSIAEAYHNSLLLLHKFGELTSCSDWNTTQKELSMTMVVEEPLSEPMISKLMIGGPKDLEQYVQEMVHGILDFEVEKGKWAYTYHSRAAQQIPLVIAELKRNPDSRRAVIDIRDWHVDMESNDPACLQHIQYFIRDGKLHCKVLFRSNDACKATFMNAFALIMLQKYIADCLYIDVGTYTHRANSFHCYARDFAILDSYAEKIATKRLEDLSYNYKGEWDELMAEARPEIAKMVEELKGR